MQVTLCDMPTRWTRATRCLTHIVLYTEMDAQCDKLHGQARQSTVDRRKYCQLSSTDRNLGNFFSILCIPNKSLNCALSGGIRSDNLGNF